jgi:hypothetical protein
MVVVWPANVPPDHDIEHPCSYSSCLWGERRLLFLLMCGEERGDRLRLIGFIMGRVVLGAVVVFSFFFFFASGYVVSSGLGACFLL